MKSERTKILEMLSEGLISSKEAYQLLENRKEEKSKPNKLKTFKETYFNRTPKRKTLYILIKSATETVDISLPTTVIKNAIKMGKAFSMLSQSINASSDKNFISQNVDIDLILDCIDKDYEGEIINITSDNGESILISIY